MKHLTLCATAAADNGMLKWNLGLWHGAKSDDARTIPN